MKSLAAALLAVVSVMVLSCEVSKGPDTLYAGFARVAVTPPLGTAMTGFGGRDYDPGGCRGIHDELYARALFLSQGESEMLIMGFDLLFFSRDEADRFKGAIGRKLGLEPASILLNCSHTHTGPKVGTWFYTPSDPAYLDFLEDCIIDAVAQAKDSVLEVQVSAGSGSTKLPMSRRRPRPDGGVDFAPYPDGAICGELPVVMLKDMTGTPVCLLFSASCHPSTIKGVERSYWISADYPGAAMARIDDWLGKDVSLFLQGAGGDSKASVIGVGSDVWKAGSWDDVDRAGQMLADEVIALAESGLRKITPSLGTVSIEMDWPLKTPFSREEYAEILENPQAHSESMPEVMQAWAREQIAKLDRGFSLKSSVAITAHGISLGENVRIVGIEGELVAELGNMIVDYFGTGVTFPLGYTNGAQMYLPTSAMLIEGGYEVESYWEYRQPSALAGGHEAILSAALDEMSIRGIR